MRRQFFYKGKNIITLFYFTCSSSRLR